MRDGALAHHVDETLEAVTVHVVGRDCSACAPGHREHVGTRDHAERMQERDDVVGARVVPYLARREEAIQRLVRQEHLLRFPGRPTREDRRRRTRQPGERARVGQPTRRNIGGGLAQHDVVSKCRNASGHRGGVLRELVIMEDQIGRDPLNEAFGPFDGHPVVDHGCDGAGEDGR